jgi:hypothetical protein
MRVHDLEGRDLRLSAPREYHVGEDADVDAVVTVAGGVRASSHYKFRTSGEQTDCI